MPGSPFDPVPVRDFTATPALPHQGGGASEVKRDGGALPIAANLRVVALWCERGLALGLVLLPPLLAMVPHGAAPLAGFAGLCAAGLLIATGRLRQGGLRQPAALLLALLLWGALSTAWSIVPGWSLILDLRLAGLAAAALALIAAVPRIAAPWRLGLCLIIGTALGAALALGDLATAGGLSRTVSVRAFTAARLNQLAAWLAILALPASAFVFGCGRRVAALLLFAGMAAAVAALDGTGAKMALALSLPAAGLFFWRRRWTARIAAVIAAAAILTAPLTLPRLASLPGVFATADAFKDSAGHRLLIWSFAGDRIAERPFVGWGLDAARAIPGGSDEIRPAQNWLPLHPHDAALQVWLELGAPGAALFALLAALLWLRLAAAAWPRLYAAAAGGSCAAAFAIALEGWGIWQEWWLATLALALFAVLVMARAAQAGLRNRIPRGSRDPLVRIPDGSTVGPGFRRECEGLEYRPAIPPRRPRGWRDGGR
ncbi:MAG: O-antigen ligase family protein [Thiohalocapsa sp.]